MQAGANGSDDVSADSRWMSYTELAEIRRITTSSAIRLVKRRGWRRQKDNHGTMRALVPPEWTEPAPGKDFDPSVHVNQAISALEMAVAALRQRAEAAEHAARLERERADRAIESRNAERSRTDLLRYRVDALKAELASADAAVEAARQEAWEAAQRADAARQAATEWEELGRLERIRRAWRGRPT
jgi:hypothetical protein